MFNCCSGQDHQEACPKHSKCHKSDKKKNIAKYLAVACCNFKTGVDCQQDTYFINGMRTYCTISCSATATIPPTMFLYDNLPHPCLKYPWSSGIWIPIGHARRSHYRGQWSAKFSITQQTACHFVVAGLPPVFNLTKYYPDFVLFSNFAKQRLV